MSLKINGLTGRIKRLVFQLTTLYLHNRLNFQDKEVI